MVAGLLGLASGLYIVLGWHSGTDVGFVPWLAMALMATVFALLQFSRFRAALWLLLWGAVMVSLLGGIRRSGFDSPALMALPVLVTTGGWLLGRRQAMWMLA